jgi:hypothetical protein
MHVLAITPLATRTFLAAQFFNFSALWLLALP